MATVTIDTTDCYECDGCHGMFDYKMRDDKGGICLPCRHCCDCGCCCDEEEADELDCDGFVTCAECGQGGGDHSTEECPSVDEEPVQERMAGSIVTTTVSFKRWVADHPEVWVADHSTDTTDQNDS